MKKDKFTPENTQPYTGRTYAYISIGLTALGAVFIGLTFTVLGIYALIASILLSLAAVAFANVQKRKNDFKQLLIIRILSHIVLCIGVILFVGGLIWSATK